MHLLECHPRSKKCISFSTNRSGCLFKFFTAAMVPAFCAPTIRNPTSIDKKIIFFMPRMYVYFACLKVTVYVIGMRYNSSVHYEEYASNEQSLETIE